MTIYLEKQIENGRQFVLNVKLYMFSKKHKKNFINLSIMCLMLTLLTWLTKTNTYTFANPVDPEAMTHNELSHEDLQLLLIF